MLKSAKVLIRDSDGDLFVLGQVQVELKPRYANGGYFLRNLIKYDSNLKLSKKANEKEFIRDIPDYGLRTEAYIVSDYEGMRKFFVKLENKRRIKLRIISNCIPILKEEREKILRAL